MKPILVESQRLHQKNFWSFLNKVVRFRKNAILQPSFSNKLFLKLNLSKNYFSKSCCPKLIFFNDFFFVKIWTIFDVENDFESQIFAILRVYLLCQKKVQKKF